MQFLWWVVVVVACTDHCARRLLHSPKKLLENGSKRSTMELEYWEKEVEKEELVSQWLRMPSSTYL